MMSNYSICSWGELPAELLQYILQEVHDKQSIFQCQLVCKSWKQPAERVAYHTIDISSYNRQLKKLVHTLHSSEYFGKCVSQLHLNITTRNPQKHWDRRGYFERLADYCPNIKVLTSRTSCHWLWTRLCTQQDRWENLQEIPRPFYSDDMELYSKTAFAFRDRLTHLTIMLYPQPDITFFLVRDLLVELISDLSMFSRLKHLEIEKPNGFKLEEVDKILDSCPKLISFTVRRRHACIKNARGCSDTNSLGILEKMNFFKPKKSIRKFNFSFTTDGGEETLYYIMRLMPNLETLYFNPTFYKTNLVCSSPVLISFLQYALSIKTVEVKYLACEDVVSLLPLYWNSEEYKSANKTKVSLAIEESNFIDSRPHNKPYIGMSSRREVIVSYEKLDESRSHVELIENIGAFLTHLRVGRKSLGFYSITENTSAISQERFLEHIFKCCPLLKKLEGYFYNLQSYYPKSPVHTSMEELVLLSTVVHPSVLEQLSIQLPNLERISFMETTFTKYDGKYIHGKKLEINMPNTQFETLYIAREFSDKYYSDFFLKYSSKNGDAYYCTSLNSDVTELSESSLVDYHSKMSCKTTYFLNLRCQTFRELIVQFGPTRLQFLTR